MWDMGSKLHFFSFLLKKFLCLCPLCILQSCVSFWEPPAPLPWENALKCQDIEYRLHISPSLLNISLRSVQLVCILEDPCIIILEGAWSTFLKNQTYCTSSPPIPPPCVFIGHFQPLWIYKILVRTCHPFIHSPFFLAYPWNFCA